MSMEEDSNVNIIASETPLVDEGPCGGALEKKQRNFRRLRSRETNKILHQKKENTRPKSNYDPTAWYVIQTKRYKEIDSCNILNSDKGFYNNLARQSYFVEAYAAVQKDEGNKVLIHGKIFVRVDEANRVDVLKQCPFLKGYVKDPSRSLTVNRFTGFARVPDREMKAMRAILEIADGEVDYSEQPIEVKDKVRITTGILAKSEALKGLEGSVEICNGQKRATVILDKLGVFKFNLPVSQLRKKLNENQKR